MSTNKPTPGSKNPTTPTGKPAQDGRQDGRQNPMNPGQGNAKPNMPGGKR